MMDLTEAEVFLFLSVKFFFFLHQQACVMTLVWRIYFILLCIYIILFNFIYISLILYSICIGQCQYLIVLVFIIKYVFILCILFGVMFCVLYCVYLLFIYCVEYLLCICWQLYNILCIIYVYYYIVQIVFLIVIMCAIYSIFCANLRTDTILYLCYFLSFLFRKYVYEIGINARLQCELSARILNDGFARTIS